MSLKNKKIVLCRRREQAREMVLLLHRKGAWPFVFPTFRLEPIELSKDDIEIFQNLKLFDWLVLGSKNGVNFFAGFLQMLEISIQELGQLSVGLVGKKTNVRCKSLFPNIPIDHQADNLQQLLNSISEADGNSQLKILNPTSRQSLENIKVDIPGNIELTRLPVYQSLPDHDHESGELDYVVTGDYDAVYFGAPSAFDYFLQVVGEAPLQNVPICVSGNTTAAHIQNAGYEVAVVPPKPDARYVIRALEEYFLNMKSTVHPKTN